jgi:hypothetical protein
MVNAPVKGAGRLPGLDGDEGGENPVQFYGMLNGVSKLVAKCDICGNLGRHI